MADSTSIQIVARDQNDKTVNTTITDVNPDATPSELKTLAQKLNALTTNTYDKTTRIDKLDVDTATDRVARQPNFSWRRVLATGNEDVPVEPATTIKKSELGSNSAQVNLNFRISADDFARINMTDTSKPISQLIINNFTYYASWVRWQWNQATDFNEPITFTIEMAGTDRYLPWSQEFTFTFVDDTQ